MCLLNDPWPAGGVWFESSCPVCVTLRLMRAESLHAQRLLPGLRGGPTGREVLLTHAVSRIMLDGYIDNIQVCSSRGCCPWGRLCGKLRWARVFCLAGPN
jgi:hypothetical protein